MNKRVRVHIASILAGAGCAVVLWSPGSLAEQSAARFTLVLEGAAVKDASTGLIWEQDPDREHDVWSRSIERCKAKEVGGRHTWRAPSVDELKSLIDQSQHDPALPPGHPFSNIKSEIYWTATPDPKDDIVAWQVSFFSGEPVTDQKSGTRRMWCVLDEPKP
ncbi:conserved protein of unknown function [Nitrospira japonica]|uniref:Lcl C-terminal domain-containing protein n=1 Tax=Nitrospira japonica TaxID=1325564 RepID=A0A1W1I241_9BACT|nr:DUF1566 domain-containing protein [Nitrospira japonica]SLM47067.1 conserved protein of unknown function [Nitrospira japonica]